MTNTDLCSLMTMVNEHYVFDEDNYPGFSKLSHDQQRAFIAKHSVLHLNKSVAKIAAEAESADHGGHMNENEITVATTKLLVSVLALAGKFAVTPEVLAASIPYVMKSK